MRIVAGLILYFLYVILAGYKPAFTDVPGEDLSSSYDVLFYKTIDLLEEEPSPYEVPETPEPTQDDYLIRRVDVADGETFSVSFKPNESMLELTVTFTLVGECYRDPSPTYYYYLCILKQQDEVLQSFEISTIRPMNSLYPELDVNFFEFDFDGHFYMSVIWDQGIKYCSFDYYRYDAENNVFEENPCFSTAYKDATFHPDTKQVIISNYIDDSSEMYQYADGKYTLMRTERTTICFETEIYDVRINEIDESGEWVEIYSETLTWDEYRQSITIRDNILRFGTMLHK